MPPRIVELLTAAHRERAADLIRASKRGDGKARITLTTSLD